MDNQKSSDYLILDLMLKKSAEVKDRFLKLNSLEKSQMSVEGNHDIPND